MSDGEMQDLAHEISAHAHYGMVAFKEEIAAAVEIGRTLAAARRGLASGEWRAWLAENAPFDDRDAATFMEAFRFFGDHEGYSEEQWEELSGLHLEATVKWLDMVSGRLRPAKRWRTKQLLRKNPMAGLALVSLRRAAK